MQKFRRIFVFGSGFSNSFCSNMPTLPKLTKSLFNKETMESLCTDNFTELFNLVDKFKKIDKSICTIEKLTTTIFSRRIYSDSLEREKYNKLKYQIKRYIYKTIDKWEVDKENEQILRDFLIRCRVSLGLKKIHKKTNLIITFNYDLLIEKFLHLKVDEIEKSNRVLGHPEYIINLSKHDRIPRSMPRPHTDPIHIIKLHGSFNWFQVKGSKNIDISSIYIVNPWDESRIIYDNDNPIFIPMAHGKELFLYGSLYNFLWARAFQYIHDAEEIYFIGYGFPEMDINNLYNFSDPMIKRKIKKIVILDNSDNQNELERLKRLFGDRKVINKNAKKFIQEDVEMP
ncbi:MAG: SIR2 family protein [bacterium]